MTMFDKLVRPAPDAKSRLHDLSGRRVSPRVMIENMPRALWSRAVLGMLGFVPQRPWISYDATAILERKLRSATCAVLEFGSGSSTAWFARRAHELHSVENDQEWYNRVKRQIDTLGSAVAIVEYEFQPEREKYTTFRCSSNNSYDIILIDGPWRQECIANHMHLLATDGILYVDNSDADSSTGEEGEIGKAIETLRAFAKDRSLREEVFTDFVPCGLHATQGILFTSAEQFEKLELARRRR